jgi:hypothetical protein
MTQDEMQEPTPAAPAAAPDTASQPETSPPPPRGRSRWPAILAALTVLVLMLAAAVTSFPLWRDAVGIGPVKVERDQGEIDSLRAELAATTERLRRLELRVADLPEVPASASPTKSGGGDAVAGRLAGLEQTVRSLQSQPSVPARLTEEIDAIAKQVADLRKSAADAAAVLRLADRVEQNEAAVREMQARRSSAAALLLAVGQLRDAAAFGLPFDAELRSLKALAPQDEEVAATVDRLRPRAAAGIPTRATLVERFDALAPRLVRAEILPGSDVWWRRPLDRVLSLVVIRREDGAAAGAGVAAIVARAQAALARNDFSDAIDELGLLTTAPAEVAAPWIADGRARVEADRALSDLTARSVAQMGAKVAP